jgi:hypothetical protein
MSKTEVERIQEQLGNLNLNPYPQWVLVEDQLNAQQEQHQMLQQAQYVAQQYMPQQQQAPPQAKDFFMQFVNRKIPALVNNPFTQFPIENELAYARSFFQQHMPSPESALSSVDMEHMTTAHGMSDGGMSQFKNILESTDQNALRQLKESLSPSVLAKLQSVFGSGETSLDMNRLPPEVMSFIAQNQHQHGIPSVPTGFQEPHHPMATFSHSQLTDHFTSLQQQFRNPNYFYENQEGYYQSNEYAQPQYNYPQQTNYQNWQQ